MCHINLIFKKNREPDKKLSRYMNVVSYYSYLANDDGEGYVGIDDKDVCFDKGLEKFYFVNPYWLLATHQRLRTSGKGVGNTHPHETKDFVLMHNGIFSSLGSDEKSDSKIFADMLQEEFDKQEEDKKDLTLAIRETTKKVNGTYSVLIIEKATQRVFYFKERITSMYKIENNDWLIMSTEEKNVKFAKFWFGMKTKVKEVEHLYIYDVLNNFKKIRKFEEKPYVYQETKCYPCGGYGRGSIYGYDDDYHYTGKVERSAYDEEWIKDDRLTGIEESVSNSNGRNYRDFCDY
jgi:hypothetical protein